MLRAGLDRFEQQFGPSRVRAVLCLGVFSAIFLSGVSYTLAQPRYYQARARLWVQPKVPSSFSSAPSEQLYAPFYNSFTSPITTAAEVMRSTAVIKEAHDALATTMPRGTAPSFGEILGRLQVHPVKEADILEVAYNDKRPDVTASVVNAVVSSFVHIINAQNTGNTSQSLSLLTDERERAHKEYLKARKNLEGFQNQEDAVDLNAQTSELLKERSDIEIELKAANTRIPEIRSRLAFLQQQTGIVADQAIGFETLASDEIIQQLRHKIAAQEVRVVEMRTRFQKDSPQLRRAETGLKQLQDALTDRVKQLTVANAAESAIQSDDLKLAQDGPIKKGMLEEMVRGRAEELAQQTRVDSLEGSLADINSRLKNIPGQQLQLAELNRAVSLASDQLSDVEKRIQSARLAESLTNRQSNVQIIDEPEVPTSTSLPNIPQNTLYSFLGALAAASGVWLALMFTDPRVRNLQDITSILPVPIEAWFKTRNGNPLDEIGPSMDRLRQALNGWRQGGNKFILVISPDSHSDREIVSIGLARSFVRTGLRTALVEINAGESALSEMLNVPPLPGVLQFCRDVEKKMDLSTIMRELPNGMVLIPAGATTAQPGDLSMVLGSARFRYLVEELKTKVDVVIFDLAPISETVDGLTLLTDGVKPVVVSKVRSTFKQPLKVLAGQFKHLPVAKAALVLSNVDDVPTVSSFIPEAPQQGSVRATDATTTASW